MASNRHDGSLDLEAIDLDVRNDEPGYSTEGLGSSYSYPASPQKQNRRYKFSVSRRGSASSEGSSSSPYLLPTPAPTFKYRPPRAHRFSLRNSRIKRDIRSFCRRVLRSRHGCIRLALCASLLVFLAIIALLTIFEPQIEIRLYSRRWIREEIDVIPPLAGCFESKDDGTYNVTERVWRKRSRWEVHSGLDMMRGMDCYAFAGIVGSGDDGNGEDVATQAQQTFYHTYWRTDLIPFGPRQEYMLKSFFATQPLPESHLILWSNGDLRTNAIIQRYLRQFPDSFSLKMMEISQLAMGTALEGSDKLNTNDKKAWVDGDLLRLLVLWNFGGVWVDMDSLLTRSLRPLLEHEFVTQWDCYNKPYGPLNGALMHFHAHSAYLCEAFHIMDSSPPPRPGSTDWGSILYTKLWRRLVRAGVPPFKVLPWCFSDGRSCRIDNRLPDPFKKDGEGQGRWIPQRSGKQGERVMSTEDGGLLDEILRKVFSVHLHNQWEKDFPQDGWVERLLLRKYDRVLEGDD